MPNLQDVIDNETMRRESVDRMVAGVERRGEVRVNHGIRTPEELAALVSQPFDDSALVDNLKRLIDEHRVTSEQA